MAIKHIEPRPRDDDGSSRHQDHAELHGEYFRTRDPRLREQLISANAGLAQALANRFASRGQALEDLTQVALLALLKAIDGFEPKRGVQFSTYAVPTILGELKRHMRDHSWGIRVPRRVHDLYLEVERGVDDLAQTLGRQPAIAELADNLGLSKHDVAEAMEAASRRQLSSLEAPTRHGFPLSTALAGDDRSLADVERSVAVSALIGRLPEAEAQVVRLRFEQDMTQLEIARVMGRSQIQVSRTLARGLDHLRRLAGGGAEALLAG
jgi:RNA polymerase sigma-B factor